LCVGAGGDELVLAYSRVLPAARDELVPTALLDG
jgi:hypothetical protein